MAAIATAAKHAAKEIESQRATQEAIKLT